jgi:hypothetical protein
MADLARGIISSLRCDIKCVAETVAKALFMVRQVHMNEKNNDSNMDIILPQLIEGIFRIFATGSSV